MTTAWVTYTVIVMILAALILLTTVKENLMNANAIMRLVAVILFVLAVFGVAPGGVSPVPLGLAFWVGSSFA